MSLVDLRAPGHASPSSSTRACPRRRRCAAWPTCASSTAGWATAAACCAPCGRTCPRAAGCSTSAAARATCPRSCSSACPAPSWRSALDVKTLHLRAAPPAVRRVVADVRRLPFPDGSFDVVTASLFLHHFDEEDAAGDPGRALPPGPARAGRERPPPRARALPLRPGGLPPPLPQPGERRGRAPVDPPRLPRRTSCARRSPRAGLPARRPCAGVPLPPPRRGAVARSQARVSDASERDVVVVGRRARRLGASPASSRSAGTTCSSSTPRASPATRSAARASPPRPGGCSDAMGAADRVRALSPHPLRGMRLVSPDGTAFRGRVPGPGAAGLRPAPPRPRRGAPRRRPRRGRRGAGGGAGHRPRSRGRHGRGRRRREAGGEAARPSAPGSPSGRTGAAASSRGASASCASTRGCAASRCAGYWEGVEALGDVGRDARRRRRLLRRRPALADARQRRLRPRPARDGAAPRATSRASTATPSGGAGRASPSGSSGARLVAPPAGHRPPRPRVPRRRRPGGRAGRRRRRLLRPVHRRGRDARAAHRRARRGGPRRARSAGARPRPCPASSAYERARHAATRDKFRFNRLLQVAVGWPDAANAIARRLARRPDLADRLVGIAGDFVPARAAFGPRFLLGPADGLSRRPAVESAEPRPRRPPRGRGFHAEEKDLVTPTLDRRLRLARRDPPRDVPHDAPVAAARRQGDPAQAAEPGLLPDQRRRPRGGAGRGGHGAASPATTGSTPTTATARCCSSSA